MDSDKNTLELILNKLEIIEKKLEDIHKNTNKMEEHIQFVEATYEKIKTPFHYLMDKVNLLSFSPFKRTEILDDKSQSNEK